MRQQRNSHGLIIIPPKEYFLRLAVTLSSVPRCFLRSSQFFGVSDFNLVPCHTTHNMVEVHVSLSKTPFHYMIKCTFRLHSLLFVPYNNLILFCLPHYVRNYALVYAQSLENPLVFPATCDLDVTVCDCN